MARITLEAIAQELEQYGWKVLSTQYTNLSTEMEFQCNEGHQVFATWEKLRKKCECPVCKMNPYKDESSKIIPKSKSEKRVLALDQATYKTGWSIFDGARLIKYGVFEAKGTLEEQHIHSVRMWLVSMIENWHPDIIGIEGIQYQQEFGVTTFQTLARLQGVLIDLCVEVGIDHKICPTNTWRAHCKVKGRTRTDKKKSMQNLVKEWFDVSVTDDEADAIGIGKFLSDKYSNIVWFGE